MENLTDIYKFNDEINSPDLFEKYFNNVLNILNKSELNINQKLVYKLLIYTDEINFTEIYKLLSNNGLELIDYINHVLFDFTFKIDDDRIKFWIIYLYPNNKEIIFILWLLQYKFKKNLLYINDNKINFEDIPIINFTKDFKLSLYYQSKYLFTNKNQGISLL